MVLLLPVGPRQMSSWRTHQLRNPKSTEPGTDFYCPIGTPIVAPADGVIYGSGNTIGPATGRWVGIDFDNGMSFRTMHHSRNVITSGRVRAGQVYAYSGASGYGEEDWSWNVAETGGAHVHATLWPNRNKWFGYDASGKPYTVDLMNYVGGLASVVTATPLEDDMPSVEELMDFNVPRQGDGASGTTNLRQTIAWLDNNLNSIRSLINQLPKLEAIINGVYNTPIERKGGGPAGSTTLAATLAWLDGNLGKIIQQTGGSVDPEVVRKAVAAALESALVGTSLDPQATAKAVRAEFKSDPIR